MGLLTRRLASAGLFVVIAGGACLGAAGASTAPASRSLIHVLKLVYSGSGEGEIVQHVDNRPGHAGSDYDDTYSKSVTWSLSWLVTIEDGQVVKVSDPTAERTCFTPPSPPGKPKASPTCGDGVAGTGKAQVLSDPTESCSSKVDLPKVGQPAKPYIPAILQVLKTAGGVATLRLSGNSPWNTALPLVWADTPSCVTAAVSAVSPGVSAANVKLNWGKSANPEFGLDLGNNFRIRPDSSGGKFPFAPILPQKKVVFDWHARVTLAEASAPPPTSPTTTAPTPGKPPAKNKKKSKSQRFLFPGSSLDKLQDATRTIQLGGGGEQTIPVEDEHWPDPGTLLDEVCIVPDPKNPTGPCPKADDLAAGSLAVAPAPSPRSSGKLRLRVTSRGASALRAKKPLTVLLRVTYKPSAGAPATATRPLTLAPLAAKPVITSVTFGGSQQAPTVTVSGRNLGTRPAPNPSGSPSNRPPLCPVAIQGNAGLDYGTSLYIADDTRRLAAGRYRPSIGELDCIGLIVAKFTSTEVDYRFGSYYAQVYPQYTLAPGDKVQLGVNSATKTVHVKYGTPVTS